MSGRKAFVMLLAAIFMIARGAQAALTYAVTCAFAALIFALIFRWLGVIIVTP